MRDALGIVMRAPLVFLSAGSSPKLKDYCFQRRRGFDLISWKFFGGDRRATCGMHLLSAFTVYETINSNSYLLFLKGIEFSEEIAAWR